MIRVLVVSALLLVLPLAAGSASAASAPCGGYLSVFTGELWCGLKSFCDQPAVECHPAIDRNYGCSWDVLFADVSCGLS